MTVLQNMFSQTLCIPTLNVQMPLFPFAVAVLAASRHCVLVKSEVFFSGVAARVQKRYWRVSPLQNQV